MVVLAEEHHGRLVRGAEDHGLVDVSLARGAVAEVDDRGDVRLVPLDAHRIADGVQGLRADDDLLGGHPRLVRVPARERGAAPHPQQVQRGDAAQQGHAVLAVGREDEVVRAQRDGGAHLGGLLAQQRGPQGQLALTLQVRGLDVEAPDHGHLAVQRGEGVGVDVLDPRVELRLRTAAALRVEHLERHGLGRARRGRRAGGSAAGGTGVVHEGHCTAFRSTPTVRGEGVVRMREQGWSARRLGGVIVITFV